MAKGKPKSKYGSVKVGKTRVGVGYRTDGKGQNQFYGNVRRDQPANSSGPATS